jgi:hypothetical protein
MSAAPQVTRRGLLVAGTAVAASAAVPALLHTPAAAAQSSDVDFLTQALELEQVLAEAYQRAAPELGGIARLFRSQERAHADALTVALRQIGGGAPPSADVDARLAAMSRASGKRGVAQFLVGLENSAVRTYVGAHRSVRDARLMQLVTSILGNQAQHLVALRDVVGTQKVPTAFETGQG